jgi:ectoine hydroxylase-related dioxygenase (phytanoyl-CoA dioxygenase family)
MYHGETLWENRQNERIVGAFQQLYGRPDLWVSFDRIGFKPPVKEGWRSDGFYHWDLDPWSELPPMELQGVLSLVNSPIEKGGFQCYPGMHRTLSTWTSHYKPLAGTEKKRREFHELAKPILCPPIYLESSHAMLQSIPTEAGDMVIFRRELLHGNGCNTSSSPRICQYLTYFPARAPEEEFGLQPQQSLWREHRAERIGIFKRQSAPGFRQSGSQKKLGPRPPKLTDLGRRLVGIDDWEIGGASK